MSEFARAFREELASRGLPDEHVRSALFHVLTPMSKLSFEEEVHECWVAAKNASCDSSGGWCSVE